MKWREVTKRRKVKGEDENDRNNKENRKQEDGMKRNKEQGEK